MSRKFNAGKRAHSLAFLMVTTSLWPLTLHAPELPAVEVTTTGTGAAAGPVSPNSAAAQAQLNTTPESFYQTPLGQVQTTIPEDRMINTQAFSVFDVLRDSPGIDVKQGNGPRDIGISIRGSNAQNGFGIRNIQVFEDGFPVTQPDGLSRTDLTDPHAYGAIDVIRGPSSALYGNFATGGMINFRLRTGAQIDGVEVGTDAGSFGYLNNYLAYGTVGEDYDVSLFTSNVIGNGPTFYNLFNTQTVNALASYSPTPDDKFTLKMIGNRLETDLPIRLSLQQFYQNPYQNGCYAFPSLAAAKANGCGTVNLFLNGFGGATVAQTGYQAGTGRDDTREILGLRWEHNLDANNIWRTQVVLDDKNIRQPTGATSAQGDEPSINFMSDVTSHGTFYGFDATQFGGIYFNRDVVTSYTYNLVPGGNAMLGYSTAATTEISPTQTTDMGMHVREEIKFNDTLAGVAGLGAEYTKLQGAAYNFNYSTLGVPTLANTSTSADNNYYNIAPEGALVWHPQNDLVFKARVATGYGTPQASNLFVTSNGTSGDNTQLKSQTNLGYDLSTTYAPLDTVKLTVDGFYEFFHNELISNAAGPAPLLTYTFNAPRSEHRGVEVAAEWRFYPGFKAKIAYTYDNQIYTQYMETLTAGTLSNSFNRAGNSIPGVAPNEFTARLSYDVPFGPAKGLGGFAEYYLTDDFYVDNANYLKVPGYHVINLNLHYDTDIANSWIKKIDAYFEVRNVLNTVTMASANNISDTLNSKSGLENPGFAPYCPTTNAALSCTTGSIYAGMPRIFVGGVRIRF
jgi:iron complex outermembrane receptor protein